MSIKIRPIQDADIAFIIDLMNAYILHDPGLYSEIPISIEQANDWIQLRSCEGVPMLVAMRESRLIGVAFARPFRHQSGSAHVWESSVYLHPHDDVKRLGIGSRMLKSLLDQLIDQGVSEVIAVIDEQNEASIAFHERNGFKYVGMIHRAGYKFGQYRNAQFYQFSAAQMSAL